MLLLLWLLWLLALIRVECQCDPSQGSLGCNGRGICQLFKISNQDGQGQPYAFQLPDKGVVQYGQCKCYQGFDGKYCEIPLARIRYCSNHGQPLCTISSALSPKTIVSDRTTGARIPDHYYCDVAAADLGKFGPGYTGCQCDVGWGPNIDPNGGGTQKCNQPVPCFVPAGAPGGTPTVGGVLQGDGRCKCFNDFYDTFDSTNKAVNYPGECRSNCRVERCSARGVCAPKSSSFNEQCICDSGWGTSQTQTSLNNLLQPSEAFSKGFFCDQPRDPRTQKPCGKWGFEDTSRTESSGCAPITTNVPLRIDNALTKLWVQQCGQSDPGSGLLLDCGGVTRGSCVSDGDFGQACKCKNGWTGLDCSQPVCPSNAYNRGAVCSANGLCANQAFDQNIDAFGQSSNWDRSQGSCVCKTGFFGLSCQHKRLNCGVSQTVKSYPTCFNITAPPQVGGTCAAV